MSACHGLRFKGLVVLALVVPSYSAPVVPITSVVCDQPTGTPPYNLLSITVGSYTVAANRLAWGTASVVLPASRAGTRLPRLEDLDISGGYSNTVAGGAGTLFKVVGFGGGTTWKDSNGDDPDFFLFEGGGDDYPLFAAILPGGVVGQAFAVAPAADRWGPTGYFRTDAPADGQGLVGTQICGLAFSITDLLDASGKPLTNNSVIEGLQVTAGGLDPMVICAVVPPAGIAGWPTPSDKATDVPRDAILGWRPGETAKTHDVYFGTVFNNVSNASRTVPLGVLVSQGQDANTYDPAGLLVSGQTYYWRVDEVDLPTLSKGEVWSFTAEPVAYPITGITATASSENNAQTAMMTVNGSGLANDLHSTSGENMWLSSGAGPQPTWIQYDLGALYKLHEMWVWNSNLAAEGMVGFGVKDATVEYSADGATWALLGDVQLARAPGKAGYAHNTTVDLKGVAAKYVKLNIKNNWGGIVPQFGLSEVRFLYIPVQAREPQPASGATNIDPAVLLGWRAGREAVSHQVRVGTDANNLPVVGTVTQTSFDTSGLNLPLGQTCYWSVTEVNEAAVPSAWVGPTWSFTTPNALTVDDFESYADMAGKWIWEAWVDGYDNRSTNGSTVGHGNLPETVKVYDGRQSMPLAYDNTSPAQTSSTTRTFATAQDWTRSGLKTLVLYVMGDPTNGDGQLYVKVNDKKVTYSGAGVVKTVLWTQWNIDLASLGVDLKKVASLSIGIDGAGAKGIVYVDAIRLYPVAPALPK